MGNSASNDNIAKSTISNRTTISTKDIEKCIKEYETIIQNSISSEAVQDMSTLIEATNEIRVENVNCDSIKITDIEQTNKIDGIVSQVGKAEIENIISTSIEDSVYSKLVGTNTAQGTDIQNLLKDVLSQTMLNNKMLQGETRETANIESKNILDFSSLLLENTRKPALGIDNEKIINKYNKVIPTDISNFIGLNMTKKKIMLDKNRKEETTLIKNNIGQSLNTDIIATNLIVVADSNCGTLEIAGKQTNIIIANIQQQLSATITTKFEKIKNNFDQAFKDNYTNLANEYNREKFANTDKDEFTVSKKDEEYLLRSDSIEALELINWIQLLYQYRSVIKDGDTVSKKNDSDKLKTDIINKIYCLEMKLYTIIINTIKKRKNNTLRKLNTESTTSSILPSSSEKLYSDSSDDDIKLDDIKLNKYTELLEQRKVFLKNTPCKILEKKIPFLTPSGDSFNNNGDGNSDDNYINLYIKLGVVIFVLILIVILIFKNV